MAITAAGLVTTQLVALLLLAAARLAAGRLVLSRLLAWSALVMALGDVLMQGSQGLLYNLATRTWPTSVDLVDVMLLVQRQTGAGQELMKGVLAVVFVLWAGFFVWLFRRTLRLGGQTAVPAPVPA